MTKMNNILQLFYAGALADSLFNYEKAGILKSVTESKLKQQQIAAPGQLKQLDIKSVERLFERHTEIFGYIKWHNKVKNEENIFTGNSCLLCNIAKTMGTAQPCFIYCINQLKAMAMALNPSYLLSISETLWEGKKCIFNLKPIK